MKWNNTKKYKAEIIAVILFISIVGVQSVTFTQINTPTETSNNLVTYIGNGKGNYYDVTEADLALAIANQGGAGTVLVGADFTITSAIVLDGNNDLILDFQNHNVTVNGNIEFINITSSLNVVVKNAIVKINNPTEVTGGVIKVFSDSFANRVDFLTVENIYIDNNGGRNLNVLGSLDTYTSHNYTGIELEAIGAGSGRIDSCVFRDITMEGAGTGISIDATGSNYCNGNLFDNIYLDEFEDGVQFLSDESSENVFRHLKMQCNPITRYGLRSINGSNNVFDNLLVWDVNVVTVCPDIVYEIEIDFGALNTRINAHSIEHTNYHPDFISDNGTASSIYANNLGEFYYDADYDYKVTVNAGTGYYTARLGQYGSIPSAGSYDRNTDFQELMDLICDNSDIRIKLGNGTFLPDRYIAIDGVNITIEGSGDHTTIIKVPSGDSMASGIFSMITGDEFNITFRNMVFDCSEAAGSSVGIYFGSGSDISGLTVENCRFLRWNAGTSQAILVKVSSDDIATNIKIIDNEFYYCDYAISLDGDADPSIIQYADVSHNYFKECQFSIFCDWVRNSTISNNRIISTIGSSDGISLDDTIDVIVDGNLIVVADEGVIEDGAADYNMIYGNNIRNSGTPITVVGANTNATLNIV